VIFLVRLLPYSTRHLGIQRGGLPAFKPTGLAPQKVVDVTGDGQPTRDTYQRKVFLDGTNFFVVYWESGDKRVKYVASADGETWTVATTLWTFAVGPYYGGNVDIQYPNRGAKDDSGNAFDVSMVFSGSNGANWNNYCFTISNQTLSVTGGWASSSGDAQGGSIVADLDGAAEHWTYHRGAYLAIGYAASVSTTTTEVPYGETTTGGAKILTYQTKSPYGSLVIAKGGDNKLYIWWAGVTAIATLGTGFSDFCASSEAQAEGDPERIHLVYIKSTGELCYRKFENDALGSERVLINSGTSYPVVACGSSGKFYVFCVKDGKIWVIYNNGKKWFKPVVFFPEHTCTNPTYLSSNQNVQSGKICLVWTEGTTSPYEVWFAYLTD